MYLHVPSIMVHCLGPLLGWDFVERYTSVGPEPGTLVDARGDAWHAYLSTAVAECRNLPSHGGL